MIFEHASVRPNAIALDDLTRRRTWAELVDRATRTARLFREDLGLRPDDHAALLMGNRVEFVETVLGAILAGIWLTPINWHLQAEEIAYILADSGARVVITDEEHRTLVEGAPTATDAAPLPGEAARSSARGTWSTMEEASGVEGTPSARGTPSTGTAPTVIVAGPDLDGVLAGASDVPLPLDGPPGGTMIYTSGTTGRPKGVKRVRPATLGRALAGAGTAVAALGLDGSGPHLVTGPLYHAAPLLFAVYDQLNGAPLIIMPRWDAAETLDLVAAHGIRHTHLVPTMFIRLLRLPEETRRAFDPAPLALVLHGAAPIGVEVKRQMIEWWGPVIVEYWGATEGGVCTLVDSPDWLAHPGTVGRAIPAYEVFAVGEDGRRLPPGETGALYSRHTQLARAFEYHRAAEKTAEAYLEEGTFTIGDVGRVDADGWVYLSDRKSHMIISGGVNIYPAEVEQALQQHPAVADVGVFGIPDDEWGESVKAAVELADGLAASPALEAELLAFARERLARYKVPRSIDFVARLPRHPTGKLLVRLLREPYWKGRERRI
jgi:long-chain acyl-CoA synthetase